ncbi:MAG: S9 family peptidase [Chloroflexota bacterium]|nr:S9 family peptidase [Chloroflexota bacterium]
MRPISDFEPRERIVPIPHTTRRFSCRSALAISPDNSTLAFIADLGAGTYSAWTLPLTKPGRPSPALGVDGAALRSLSWSKRGDLIGAADRGGTELHQLYVARTDERVEKLSWSDGERVQRLLSWNASSPDGTRVAFSSNARQPTDMDIVIEDVETATERALVTGPAWHVAGGWSPDGRALLVMRVQANTDQDLFIVDPGSGAMRDLTAHEGDVSNVPAGWLADGRPVGITDHGREHLYLAAYDATSGAREVIDAPDWDVELAASSADGRAQIWSVNEDGYSTLRWQRDGVRGGERALEGVCEDLIISADGSIAAYHRTSATEAPQLWVLDLSSGAARAVFETARVVHAADLVRPELIRIPAADGDIPCFVFRPKNAAGRTAAVLYPHGGPEGQSRPGFPDRMAYLQALIDRGITLVVPNIHGSTGYGLSWQKAIHRDWGGIDARDLRAVADWMAADPRIDPARLAVYGGSYGGFATLLCVTTMPDRWKCAVDVFGVANLVTMIEHAQPNWRRFLKLWIGDLETDRAKLVERSPITHMDKVRCPMLVVQGTNDPRVPKEESDQVVERLRARGVPVEYLVFEDEGHGFTKRANQDTAHIRIIDFLTAQLA